MIRDLRRAFVTAHSVGQRPAERATRVTATVAAGDDQIERELNGLLPENPHAPGSVGIVGALTPGVADPVRVNAT